MATLKYLQLDVFTSHRFEGNQLAVFFDAGALDAGVMQTIAREMNFSESTFLIPAERPDTDIRMRIFTPGAELPMAGHPTIGSTFALAQSGFLAPGRDHLVFGLGVGPTRVELTWRGDALDFAWMDQQRPIVRRPLESVERVAKAVGIDPAAHRRTGLPMQEISCGVPYVLLPVATRADVDAASVDLSALGAIRSAFGGRHSAVYVFSSERHADDVTAYSRMFAAGLGIAEDPATGSACGPLGCYLVEQGVVTRRAAAGMVSWQGVAMGRPSRIHMAITSDGNTISRVQVGGKAVTVAKGELTTG
jgi:trans-2,3-dihydro-3-hydroxyanthranilate isomerase